MHLARFPRVFLANLPTPLERLDRLTSPHRVQNPIHRASRRCAAKQALDPQHPVPRRIGRAPLTQEF